MTRLKIFFLLIATLSISCVAVTTISFAEDERVAEESTRKFHQLLNEGNYEELYDLTDSRAKATRSKQGFINVVAQVRTRFGKFKEATLVDVSVISQPEYREVHTIYRAEFENGTQLEKFVWYVDDGKAGLFSYQIQVSENEFTP